MVIEHRKLRHHHREHEEHQPRDQRQQHAGIDERGDQLFAEGERDALEAHVAFQHLLQVAGALAGQQRGRIHHRKTALRLEGRRKRLAGLHAGGNVVQLGGKVGILLPLGQHLQRPQNGQPGADQRKELLVEDEKRLQLDLAPRQPAKARTRAHRKHMVPGMGKARPQLIGGGRRMHLFLHASTLIGQLDDELCHSSGRRSR